MQNQIPRSEHPRPDFCRKNWQNLNGEWEFYNDLSASGAERKVYEQTMLPQKIIVPFCPESKLSGIRFVDFMPAVWYAKNVSLTDEQLKGRVLWHFGACDYKTAIYVNGQKAGEHTGGYTSFSFDITPYLQAGENRLIVHAIDDVRSHKQPAGKQSADYYSRGCLYTRTTGIWQTVWLEFLPQIYIKKVKVNATDLDGNVHFETTLSEYTQNAELTISGSFAGKFVAERIFPLCGATTEQTLKIPDVRLWNVGEPNLYDVKYRLSVNGVRVDEVNGYFGVRRIDIDGYKVRINGKSVFQRLILDQGFYPNGIYTAPTDEDLKNDIKRSMRMGFNGARLHEKVFEARYLYYADKLGYLVWGEYPNWGIDISAPTTLHTYLHEWLEAVERDYNHPSIVGWCPYNETSDYEGRRQYDGNIALIYETTKAVDSTRPVIDTSGWFHTEKTDIYDVHDYEQDIAIYAQRYRDHANGIFVEKHGDRQQYDGKLPYMVSEYGGIKWTGETKRGEGTSWGYGNVPKSKREFIDRYCALTGTLLDTANIMGFCYTQLTDVEQEQNGLYFYDRTDKFTEEEIEEIRSATARKAAIEE